MGLSTPQTEVPEWGTKWIGCGGDGIVQGEWLEDEGRRRGGCWKRSARGNDEWDRCVKK